MIAPDYTVSKKAGIMNINDNHVAEKDTLD